MRPLSEMTTEQAARVRAVVFDIDDTVTRDGRLEREAFDAMWRLADAGLILVAVTGRPLGWCDVLARLWPIDLAVGENGAGWVWLEGPVLREGYFEPPERRAAQARLLDRIRERVRREMPHVRETGDGTARRCDLAFDVGEEVTLPRDDVERLARLAESEGTHVTVSTVHLHAATGAWDKARGTLRAAGEVLGEEPATDGPGWLFVGDSGNDAAAFETFEVTVGVSNVRDHLDRLPVAPRYVTDADRGRGFAELARTLMAARDPASHSR